MARAHATALPATYLVLLYLDAQPERRAILSAIREAALTDRTGIIVALGGLIPGGYVARGGQRDDPTYELTDRGIAWAADIKAAAS